MTLATVIIPTHDHDATLEFSVRTVLNQTIRDIEVVIVGDGPTPEVRKVAAELAAEDGRIEFLDLPKAGRTGADHWDAVVRAAGSPAVFYLCDDDLMLPRHVENLLVLLEDHDLVQCSNGWIDLEGDLWPYPTQLADREAIDWHLREPRRNCISITGTAHRLDTYLSLEEGWTAPPPGEWTDHYMWKKFLRMPGLRAATHPEITAIQLPTTPIREHHSQTERAAELATWAERLALPDGHRWLQDELGRANRRELERVFRLQIDESLDVVPALRQRISDLEGELDSQRAGFATELDTRRAELEEVRAELEARLAEAATSRWTTVTGPARRVLRYCRSLVADRDPNHRAEVPSDD